MGLLDGSPIPETYAGPASALPWWDPAKAKSAVFLDADMTGDEVLAKTGLDWTVEVRQGYYPVAPRDGIATLPMTGWGASVRVTDDAFLGTVTTGWTPIQNHVLRDLGEEVTGQSGAHWHTGGSLYGGRIAFLLMKFDRTLYVKGDGSPIEDYLALYLGHDGKHALTAFPTPVRIWCGNTLAMADEGAKLKATIRHSVNAMGRVDEVRRAIGLHDAYMTHFGERMNDLARRPMTWADIERFTEVLLPVAPGVEHPYKTLKDRALIVQTIKDSPNLADLDLTAYRTLQGVTEYIDHRRVYRDTPKGAGQDRQTLSLIEGRDLDLKSDALALLVTA